MGDLIRTSLDDGVETSVLNSAMLHKTFKNQAKPIYAVRNKLVLHINKNKTKITLIGELHCRVNSVM